MALYTLTGYFGDSGVEAEIAEDEPIPENITARLRTWKRDADDDAGILDFVAELERRHEGIALFRKILEIRDPSGRILSRAAR